MTVADFIAKLQQFPQDVEVQITDGYNFKFYKGDFSTDLFKGDDGEIFLDIGIGGCDYE